MRTLWHKYKKNNIDINLDECGIEQCSPGLLYKYLVEQNYVIHYILEGTGEFTLNEHTHILKKGDGFILTNGASVSYRASLDNPWKYCWVGISGARCVEYLKRTTLLKHNTFTYPDNSIVAAKIENICQLSANETRNNSPSNSNDLHMIKDVYEMLYALTQEFPKSHTIEDPHNNSIVQSVVNYINTHYTEDISVNQIAELENMSRSYLYKLFYKEMKQSPQTYLISLRMYHAAQLLKETNLPVQNIAYEVGYVDPLHFSRAFKKYFSMSPSLYRQQFT